MAGSIASRIWESAFGNEITTYDAKVGQRLFSGNHSGVLDFDQHPGHSGVDTASGAYFPLYRESDGGTMAIVEVPPDRSSGLSEGDHVLLVGNIDRYFWMPIRSHWISPPRGKYIDVVSIIWE